MAQEMHWQEGHNGRRGALVPLHSRTLKFFKAVAAAFALSPHVHTSASTARRTTRW